MIIAPFPKDEAERLKALWDYEILDTGAEQVFDDIVALVADICDVPIALVSLVDKERQWFKAKLGLEADETHRDLAFCAHAIHQTEPMVVEDAQEDQRFYDNPLVTGGPHIRFYAGAPIRAESGYALGTLCAIDTRPRALDEAQLRLLERLSRHVAHLLQLRNRYRDSLQLADELASSRAQVLEMAQHNRRFLANLNHEMRTPLNAIIGFSKRLVERAPQYNLPAQFQQAVSAIDTAANHLHHLIGDVLDLSKLDAGKMVLREMEFAPRAMLDELLLIHGDRAAEQLTSLHLEVADGVPERLWGDQRKLSQVVMNLLSNALKYTPEGKQVLVRVAYREAGLSIEVADQGVGIAADDLPRIFTEFEQVGEPLPHRARGTGLGLAIVKRLLMVLEGDITVESTPGTGSSFRVWVPMAEP